MGQQLLKTYKATTLNYLAKGIIFFPITPYQDNGVLPNVLENSHFFLFLFYIPDDFPPYE